MYNIIINSSDNYYYISFKELCHYDDQTTPFEIKQKTYGILAPICSESQTCNYKHTQAFAYFLNRAFNLPHESIEYIFQFPILRIYQHAAYQPDTDFIPLICNKQLFSLTYEDGKIFKSVGLDDNLHLKQCRIEYTNTPKNQFYKYIDKTTDKPLYLESKNSFKYISSSNFCLINKENTPAPNVYINHDSKPLIKQLLKFVKNYMTLPWKQPNQSTKNIIATFLNGSYLIIDPNTFSIIVEGKLKDTRDYQEDRNYNYTPIAGYQNYYVFIDTFKNKETYTISITNILQKNDAIETHINFPNNGYFKIDSWIAKKHINCSINKEFLFISINIDIVKTYYSKSKEKEIFPKDEDYWNNVQFKPIYYCSYKATNPEWIVLYTLQGTDSTFTRIHSNDHQLIALDNHSNLYIWKMNNGIFSHPEAISLPQPYIKINNLDNLLCDHEGNKVLTQKGIFTLGDWTNDLPKTHVKPIQEKPTSQSWQHISYLYAQLRWYIYRLKQWVLKTYQ